MLEPFTPIFFRRLQHLKIRTRRAFLGSKQGRHISLRRGQGLEFADYRLYSPGDDFRHIDWGAYARTDRLYIRQFRDEQDLNVIFLIDASASMGLPLGEGKFELTKQLALALSYIALVDGDAVTYSILGQKNTARYVGGKALPRAVKELNAVSPGGTFSFSEEIRAAVANIKTPGKCFVLSDFLIELPQVFSALDVLRAKNFEIALLQILAPSELKLDIKDSAPHVIDAESKEGVTLGLSNSSVREYATLLAEHVHALEVYCRKATIPHLLLSSAESVSDIVLTKLPQQGLLK